MVISYGTERHAMFDLISLITVGSYTSRSLIKLTEQITRHNSEELAPTFGTRSISVGFCNNRIN